MRQLYRERKEKGKYHLFIREMKSYDHMMLHQQFRITPGPEQYENLFRLVAPKILKSSQKREAIEPGERLSVTLRHLVTGDAQTTIAASYRMSKTSVPKSHVLW